MTPASSSAGRKNRILEMSEPDEFKAPIVSARHGHQAAPSPTPSRLRHTSGVDNASLSIRTLATSLLRELQSSRTNDHRAVA